MSLKDALRISSCLPVHFDLNQRLGALEVLGWIGHGSESGIVDGRDPVPRHTARDDFGEGNDPFLEIGLPADGSRTPDEASFRIV